MLGEGEGYLGMSYEQDVSCWTFVLFWKEFAGAVRCKGRPVMPRQPTPL